MDEVLTKEIIDPFLHFVDSEGRWVTFVIQNVLYFEEARGDNYKIKLVDGSTYELTLGEDEQNIKTFNRLMGFPLGGNVYR